MRACRDAVKAGRCDGAMAGCEVSRPRLDCVEHGAFLEWTGAMTVAPGYLLMLCSPGTDDHVAKSGVRG